MLARFLPQSFPFFELLASQSDLLKKENINLALILEHKHETEITAEIMRGLKEDVGQLSTDIVGHLSQTFITPIDKEDIHAISSGQEHLSSMFYHLSTKFFCCGLPQGFPSTIHLLIGNIQILIEDIEQMIKKLPQKVNISEILQHFKRTKEEGMTLLTSGFAKLQHTPITESNCINEGMLLLIVYYNQIERIMIQIQSIADTLEKVMIKYV